MLCAPSTAVPPSPTVPRGLGLTYIAELPAFPKAVCAVGLRGLHTVLESGAALGIRAQGPPQRRGQDFLFASPAELLHLISGQRAG